MSEGFLICGFSFIFSIATDQYEHDIYWKDTVRKAMEPPEQDWNTFQNMIPRLRERYLEERNKIFSEILNGPDRSPTEQFWDTLEAMNKQKKILEDCLDGHTKSNMDISIMLMLNFGIMKDEDLEVFSDEFQEWIHQGR